MHRRNRRKEPERELQLDLRTLHPTGHEITRDGCSPLFPYGDRMIENVVFQCRFPAGPVLLFFAFKFSQE